MSTAIQNAKHDLRREMSLLGYTDDEMAELSPIIARFTKRVVVAELSMREAARKAIEADASPLRQMVDAAFGTRR